MRNPELKVREAPALDEESLQSFLKKTGVLVDYR